MLDRLFGVTHYAVNVTPVSGRVLDDLKDRVRVMNREVRHLMMAITRIENGINNSRSLTDGVMNSRNWTLSVVISHCYIQSLLGANPGGQAAGSHLLAKFQLYNMFKQAAGNRRKRRHRYPQTPQRATDGCWCSGGLGRKNNLNLGCIVVVSHSHSFGVSHSSDEAAVSWRPFHGYIQFGDSRSWQILLSKVFLHRPTQIFRAVRAANRQCSASLFLF